MNKAMKAMSIIGIILAALSLTSVIAFNNSVDYNASAGWGMIACVYLLALSIVALVKSYSTKEVK